MIRRQHDDALAGAAHRIGRQAQVSDGTGTRAFLYSPSTLALTNETVIAQGNRELTAAAVAYNNLAEKEPGVVALLKARMDAWVTRREAETGLKDPIHTQGDWHGIEGIGPFKSSQQAYDTLHIGSVGAANRLQAGRKPDAEKRRRNATAAPAASIGAQPASSAFEWKRGITR